MLLRPILLAAILALPCAPAGAASPSCAADAQAQQLDGPALDAFMTRCEAGRTPPIVGTPHEPLPSGDPAEVCNAKAVGDKMTGEARQNYVESCVKKGGRP